MRNLCDTIFDMKTNVLQDFHILIVYFYNLIHLNWHVYYK